MNAVFFIEGAELFAVFPILSELCVIVRICETWWWMKFEGSLSIGYLLWDVAGIENCCRWNEWKSKVYKILDQKCCLLPWFTSCCFMYGIHAHFTLDWRFNKRNRLALQKPWGHLPCVDSTSRAFKVLHLSILLVLHTFPCVLND